jgi:uncharacterized membrane protein
MEEVVKTATHYLSASVELVSALIIAYATLKALIDYIKNVWTNIGPIIPKNEIRLSFGRSLVLALEFLLAADILKTAVAPTWTEIGQLAAIAVLRTGLNYFLERELRHMQEKKEVENVEM